MISHVSVPLFSHVFHMNVFIQQDVALIWFRLVSAKQRNKLTDIQLDVSQAPAHDCLYPPPHERYRCMPTLVFGKWAYERLERPFQTIWSLWIQRDQPCAQNALQRLWGRHLIASPSLTTGGQWVIKELIHHEDKAAFKSARCHSLYALALGRYWTAFSGESGFEK